MTAMLMTEHYTRGEAFQAEKQHLFGRAWLPIGAAAQLAATGDFVSANIGGWPVLAARGVDGVVRAMMNTCRHKNMLVVDAANGRCNHFRCRFHGWTYGLDGRFRDAPRPVAPADSTSEAHHLKTLGTQIAHGMVFANLDANAAAGGFDVPAGGAAADYAGAVVTDISCNWKALLEHVLDSEPATAWHAPLVLARSLGEARVMEQVMPRSFLRTRLISHVYARHSADRAAVLQQGGAHAAERRQTAETVQGLRAGGTPYDGAEARVASLHETALAAYAAAST